jgi:hypothetical protein
MQVVVHTCRVHMRVVLLVGRVHMHVALLTSHVPIDRLVYVEDLFLFSFVVELCKLSLAL